MRNEKKLLVDEIVKYLDKSDYAFFTDFRGMTVAEMTELRRLLRQENLNLASKNRRRAVFHIA